MTVINTGYNQSMYKKSSTVSCKGRAQPTLRKWKCADSNNIDVLQNLRSLKNNTSIINLEGRRLKIVSAQRESFTFV